MAELQRQEITARIREARTEAGLTLKEMAEALDVVERTYWNYEDSRDGQGRVPWNLLGRISEITGKSKTWLLHGDTPDVMGAMQGDRAILDRLDRIEGLLFRLAAAEGVEPIEEAEEAAAEGDELSRATSSPPAASKAKAPVNR